MSAPTIAFFTTKGRVGCTSLVYHLAWMLCEQGKQVLLADLDPQAALSSRLLDENRLEDLLRISQEDPTTVFKCLQPPIGQSESFREPSVEVVDEGLGLLVGDLRLATLEEECATLWARHSQADPQAFVRVTAFRRMICQAAESFSADLVLLDLAPNLGALNRAALLAADRIVVPLAPDLFSVKALQTLGPALRRWRREWEERPARMPSLSTGEMKPLGYILQQNPVRLDRPMESSHRWATRIPEAYREAVLSRKEEPSVSLQEDPHCLARVDWFSSLIPLAQEARKPVFLLKPADGALGSHLHAVRSAARAYGELALKISREVGIETTARAVTAPSELGSGEIR